MILRDEQICYFESLPYLHQSHMPAHLEPLDAEAAWQGGTGGWAAGLNFSLFTCTNPKGCGIREDPNKPASRVRVGSGGSERSGVAGHAGGGYEDQDAAGAVDGAGLNEYVDDVKIEVGADDWRWMPVDPSARGGFGGGSFERGCTSCAVGGEVIAEL